MGLKTLKDIRFIDSSDEFGKDELRSTRDIRQEAIKWVKYFEESDTIDRLDKNSYFIKHFFNIEESELMEAQKE